ncbi:hypothetical protein D3C85_101360 [compost metagenome]
MDKPMQSDDDYVTELSVRTLARDRCSPELEEVYVNLNKSLIKSNTTSHLDEMDLLFGMLNDLNIDPTEVVSSLDEVLRIAAETSLNICGVELSPDIPIAMLAEIYEIIVNFDPTDTPTILVDLLDSAEDVDEAFVKLVAQLGTYDEDLIAEQILQIHDNFTKNVRRVCKSAVEADNVNEITSTRDGELLKRLSRLVKTNKDSIGAEMGSNDEGLGVSMEALYGLAVGRLIDKPMDEAINDIFSLAVISNESFEDAKISIGNCLDDLFFEMDDRRRAEQVKLKLFDVYQPIFGAGHAEV